MLNLDTRENDTWKVITTTPKILNNEKSIKKSVKINFAIKIVDQIKKIQDAKCLNANNLKFRALRFNITM